MALSLSLSISLPLSLFLCLSLSLSLSLSISIWPEAYQGTKSPSLSLFTLGGGGEGEVRDSSQCNGELELAYRTRAPEVGS